MQNIYPNFLFFYSIFIISKIETSLHMKIPFFKTKFNVVNDHLCMKDVIHNVHIPMFTRILDYAKARLQTLKHYSIMQTTSFCPLVVHEQFAQINNDVHQFKVPIIFCTSQHVKNKKKHVQHIHVIVVTIKAEMTMPYPQALICNCFQDYTTMFIIFNKLALLNSYANFPIIMHAFQRGEHPWLISQVH